MRPYLRIYRAIAGGYLPGTYTVKVTILIRHTTRAELAVRFRFLSNGALEEYLSLRQG